MFIVFENKLQCGKFDILSKTFRKYTFTRVKYKMEKIINIQVLRFITSYTRVL